jgi:hypothetical protein
MTEQSCARGHTIYLNMLESHQIKNGLGGRMLKPKMKSKKKQKRRLYPMADRKFNGTI